MNRQDIINLISEVIFENNSQLITAEALADVLINVAQTYVNKESDISKLLPYDQNKVYNLGDTCLADYSNDELGLWVCIGEEVTGFDGDPTIDPYSWAQVQGAVDGDVTVTFSGAISTVTNANLTPNRFVITDSNGKLAAANAPFGALNAADPANSRRVVFVNASGNFDTNASFKFLTNGTLELDNSPVRAQRYEITAGATRDFHTFSGQDTSPAGISVPVQFHVSYNKDTFQQGIMLEVAMQDQVFNLQKNAFKLWAGTTNINPTILTTTDARLKLVDIGIVENRIRLFMPAAEFSSGQKINKKNDIYATDANEVNIHEGVVNLSQINVWGSDVAFLNFETATEGYEVIGIQKDADSAYIGVGENHSGVFLKSRVDSSGNGGYNSEVFLAGSPNEQLYSWVGGAFSNNTIVTNNYTGQLNVNSNRLSFQTIGWGNSVSDIALNDDTVTLNDNTIIRTLVKDKSLRLNTLVEQAFQTPSSVIINDVSLNNTDVYTSSYIGLYSAGTRESIDNEDGIYQVYLEDLNIANTSLGDGLVYNSSANTIKWGIYQVGSGVNANGFNALSSNYLGAKTGFGHVDTPFESNEITAKVDIGPNQGAVASLRIRPSSATPTTLREGDIWIEGGQLIIYLGGARKSVNLTTL